MGSLSIVHWLVILAVIMLFFGAGRIPRLMGDVAKGVKAFKAGMKDEDETVAANRAAAAVENAPAHPVSPTLANDKDTVAKP